MKRFRRVLSVAVTLILIVTLFSDSLSAAFISAGPGAADPVNDGIVGTVEGDDLDSADPAGDNSAQTPPEQTGDPSADPSTDPTVGPNVVPSADPNVDPNSGLPNEILGDDFDLSGLPAPIDLDGSYDQNPDNWNGVFPNPSDVTLSVGGTDVDLSSGGGIFLTDESGEIVLNLKWLFGSGLDFTGKTFTYEIDCPDVLTDIQGSGRLIFNGNDYGHYTLGKDPVSGKYVFTLDFTDANVEPKTVQGVELTLKLQLPGQPEDRNDEDDFSVDLGDETLHFVYKNDTSELTVNKTPSGTVTFSSIDPATGEYVFTQDYTITFSVNGSAYNLNLADVLEPSNLADKVSNFKIDYHSKNSTKVDAELQASIAALESDPSAFFSRDGAILNGSGAILKGRMYNGDTMTITYTVEFRVPAKDGESILKGGSYTGNVDNTFYYSWEKSADGLATDVKTDNDNKPNFNFKRNVTKTGSRSEKGGKNYADWKVTFDLGDFLNTNNLQNLVKSGLLSISDVNNLSTADYVAILNYLGLTNFGDEFVGGGQTLDGVDDFDKFFTDTKYADHFTVNGTSITLTYQTELDTEHAGDFVNNFKYVKDGKPQVAPGTVPGFDNEKSGLTKGGYTHNEVSDPYFTWTINYTVVEKDKGKTDITITDTPDQRWEYGEFNESQKDLVHKIIYSNSHPITITYYTKDSEGKIVPHVETLDNLDPTYVTVVARDDTKLELTFKKEATYGNIQIVLDTQYVNPDGTVYHLTEGSAAAKNTANSVSASTYYPQSTSSTVDADLAKSGSLSRDNRTVSWTVFLKNALLKNGSSYKGLLKDIYDNPESVGIVFYDELTQGADYFEYDLNSFKAEIVNDSNHNGGSISLGEAACDKDGNLYDADLNKIEPNEENVIKKAITVSDYLKNLFSSPGMVKAEYVPGSTNKVQVTFSREAVVKFMELYSVNVNFSTGWINTGENARKPVLENTNSVYFSETDGLQVKLTYDTKLKDGKEKDLYEAGKVTVQNTVNAKADKVTKGPTIQAVDVQHAKFLDKELYTYTGADGTGNAIFSYTSGGTLYDRYDDKAQEHYNTNLGKYSQSTLSKHFNFLYTVEFNPYGEKLGDPNFENNWIELTDDLDEDLSFIPNSFTVYYENEDGTFSILDESKWYYIYNPTTNDHEVNFYLPDETHLIVEYWVDVVANSDGQVVHGDNRISAMLYGETEDNDSTEPKKTQSYSVGMFLGDNSVQVKKYWQYSINGQLATDFIDDVEIISFNLYEAAWDEDLNKFTYDLDQPLKDKDSGKDLTGLSFDLGKVADLDINHTVFALVENTPKTYRHNNVDVTFKTADPVFFVFENFEGDAHGAKRLDDSHTIYVKNEVEDNAFSLNKKVICNADVTLPSDVEFTFHVKFKDESGKDITAFRDGQVFSGKDEDGKDIELKPGTDYQYVDEDDEDDENGYFIFKLKADGSVTFKQLAPNTTYEITEVEIPDGFVSVTEGPAIGNINTHSLVWTNRYEYETKAKIEAKKEVSSNVALTQAMRNKEFTFKLTETTLGVENPYTDSAKVKYGETATFAEITYTKPGDYYYEITEQGKANPNDDPNWTYSDKTIYVKVHVYKDTDGTLTATVEYRNAPDGTYGSEVLSLTNNYEAKAEATPELTKEFDGEWKTDEKTFIFNYEISGDPADGVTSESELTGFVLNDADGKITLPKLTFTKPGIYTVEVTEDQTSKKSGVIYDGETITITYDVTDNGNGELSVSGPTYSKGTKTGDDTKKFVNKKTTDAVVTIPVAKRYEGDKGDNSTFNFTIEYTSGGEKDGYNITNSTISVSADSGSSSAFTSTEAFGITFSKAGTYEFTIKEVSGTDKNIKYSEEERVVTIEVTDNDNDGVFETKTTLDGSSAVATFTNTYTKPTAEIELEIEKKITGRTDWVGEYEFEITGTTDGIGIPAPEFDSMKVKLTSDDVDADTMTATKSLGPVSLDVDELGLKKADDSITITYNVKEVIPEDDKKVPGITYDEGIKVVTITVTRRSGDDGDYIDVQYSGGISTFSFTNTYSASGSFNVEAEKILNNVVNGEEQPGVPQDYAFTFKLSATGEKEKAILKAADSATYVENEGIGSITVKNTGELVKFGPFNVSSADTLNFKLEEVAGDELGMVYDTTIYNVTVNFEDNGKGHLDSTVTYIKVNSSVINTTPRSTSGITLLSTVGNATFTNTYTEPKASASINVSKKLTGRGWLDDDEFEFTLTSTTGEVVRKTVTNNNKQAKFDFGPYTLADAGKTYTYTLAETNGGKTINGVKYDDSKYTVTVAVVKADNELTATATITKADGTEVTDEVMTFTNTYTKPTTSIDFEVTKNYDGDWTNAVFTFKSTDENDKSVMTENVTKAGDKAKFTYDYDIKDAGKTFTYTVTEDATTKIPGVVYDASTYTVTVTVTLNDGVLTASKSIAKDGEPAGSIEFTNEFKNTTAQFEATKTVVSGNENIVSAYNGKFTFTLTGLAGAPMPANTNPTTATNDGEGKVVFDVITYNEPGTYRYIIEEDGGDENGIFYSESVYRATVVVTTADDNSLTASEPTYELQSADGKTYTLAPNAAFENDYTAPYGSLTLNGTKKFAKNADSAAPTINNPLTFVFDVYAEATGSLLYSVPVSVDDINKEYRIEKLLDLNFDESNIGKTYKYRIVEHAIDANDKAYAGFAKDNAEYIVEVKVGEPDRYNVITSTYTITKDGEKADDIVFTNTYTALTASTSVTVNKNLTGRGWLGGDKFEFTLTSATGEVAKKTVSSADEKAQFDFGPYTIEDVGTYTYTLAETNGGKTIDGVTYDNSKYTVTVEVAYADGKLTATSTIANVTGTNVTFTNKYAASGSFSLTAKKIYKENGSEFEIGGKKFTFGLTSVDNDIISAELTATNNGNNVSFGPFDIPAPGTYKFSLREIVTDPVAGMTYDTDVRDITVVATDNNKGGYDITVNGNPAAAENNTGVTFTNEYNYNGFSVTKTVEGTKGVEERETLDFGFKVTLTYNDAPFTGAVKADKEIVGEGDGVYTFTLKHGETVNFSEIPYGVKYFVEETEAHGYTKSAENAEGVIDKDAHEAKFVNFKDKDKVGLSLTKIVTGTDGETERLFNFTVTLTQPLTGRYGELEFTEGVAHVAIKSGDTVSVTGLPADIGYTVTEAEANTEDYFTTVVNATSEGIPEGTTAEVVFTNHRDRKLGGLSVSKTVSGTDPDYNKSFNFTVTLNDRSINGMYGQMYFVNGSANITLAHGQTVVADGLPAGVGYTVYEYNSDDFEVSAFGNTGVIPENSYARASFVNTRDKKFGDLSVSKTVDGDEGWDPEQTFEFTVTLSDSTVEGVYGGMIFAGGIAHVVLKAGETATATRLPEGVTYTVTEAPVEDFTQSATGDSGVIAADTTASAVFVNTYEAKKLGNLSVTKTVSGDAADMTKVFGFRVILSDAEINGLYGDMYFENGFANIYLSHGQTATAIGLPEGTGYSVIELDSEDYIVTATGTAGFIIADYTVPASFNNHKDQPEVPEEEERTGDDSLAGVGRDRPTGDDSLAGVGMDDMNPATGDYEAESFANGTSAIVILWTMVFLFGAVVIARKRREDR